MCINFGKHLTVVKSRLVYEGHMHVFMCVCMCEYINLYFFPLTAITLLQTYRLKTTQSY